MTGQSVGVGVNAGAIANAVGIGGMVGTALNGVNIEGSKGSSVTTTTYAQRVVSVPPKSSVLLEDVPILTPGSEKALGDLFYYKEVGIGKQKSFGACHTNSVMLRVERHKNIQKKIHYLKLAVI